MKKRMQPTNNYAKSGAINGGNAKLFLNPNLQLGMKWTGVQV